MTDETRIGFIGVIIENLAKSNEVNRIIGDHNRLLRGRVGIPDHAEHMGVIALIVDGTNDEIGALAGKLGAISGVQCRSLLAKPVSKNNQ